MKIFVITNQGKRRGDRTELLPAWGMQEGQIVVFGAECDDPRCACHYSLIPLNCSRYVSMLAVVERPDLTPETFKEMVRATARKTSSDAPHFYVDLSRLDELIALAALFEDGDLIIRTQNCFQTRQMFFAERNESDHD